MCGRFAQVFSLPKLIEELDIASLPFSDIEPVFNIAPGMESWILRNEMGIMLERFHWGLQPKWAKEKKIVLFNTRKESIYEKKYFNRLGKNNKCLIPVSGYYEWKKVNKKSFPYYIHSIEFPVLFLGGIMELNGDKRAFSIITEDSDNSTKEIHHRMPLIIDRSKIKEWLMDKELEIERYAKRNSNLDYYIVSSKMNNSKYQGEDCIEPIRRGELQDNQGIIEGF